MECPSNREEETVWRPPLRGVFTLIPPLGERMQTLEDDSARERELTKQIAELVKTRSKIRQNNSNNHSDPARLSGRSKDPWRLEQSKRKAEAFGRRWGPEVALGRQMTTHETKEFPPLPSPHKRQTALGSPGEGTMISMNEWITIGVKRGDKNKNRGPLK